MSYLVLAYKLATAAKGCLIWWIVERLILKSESMFLYIVGIGLWILALICKFYLYQPNM